MHQKLRLILLFFFIYIVLAAKNTHAFLPPLKGNCGWDGTNTSNLLNVMKSSWFYAWSSNPVIFDVQNTSGQETVPLIGSDMFDKTDTELDILVKSIIFRANDKNSPRYGIYWMIGNEPDICVSSGSDGFYKKTVDQSGRCTPDVNTITNEYARFVKAIKTNDSTAKIIFGGIGKIYDMSDSNTHFAQQMVNRWKSVGPSLGLHQNISEDIEGWHIHYYGCCSWALPSRDTDFEARITTWRTWQNPQFPNHPGKGELWLSEFGPGLPNPTVKPIAKYPLLMDAIVNFIDKNKYDLAKRIDRYAWYSLKPARPYDSELFNDDNTLTSLGEKYKNLGNLELEVPTERNKLIWMGNYPKDTNQNILLNCNKFTQNTSSGWISVVRNYSALPNPLMSLNEYFFSCTP